MHEFFYRVECYFVLDIVTFIFHRSTAQEEYIEELTRFSQCLNAKSGYVHF